MTERITKVTQQLLQGKEKLLEERNKDLAAKYGEITGSGGGDAEHDEIAIRILDEWDQARRQVLEFHSSFAQAEIMEPPTQNESVEVGHRVEVFFGGASDDRAYATIVTPINLNVLAELQDGNGKKKFDNESEMVVSDESPLGKALIGSKTGDTVTVTIQEKFQPNRSFKVKIGSIETASIF